MKTLSIITASLLLFAAQVCSIAACKVSAQTTAKTEPKDEPNQGDVATVKHNPAKPSVAGIITAIEKIGYKAALVSEKTTAKQS